MPASLPLIATVRLTAPDTPPEEGVPPVLVESFLATPRAIALPTLPPLDTGDDAHDAFELAREAESPAEAAELKRLEGVYLGQIRGRLARVLEMTVAHHRADAGRCEARVIQNERGEVMDIDLADCSFDASGKNLLTSAIRRASPLPSPPAGLAMSSSLTLDLSQF